MRTATKTSLACQLCWERPLWVLMWVGTWPQPAGMGPMQVTAREASARSLLGRATAEAIGPSGTPRARDRVPGNGEARRGFRVTEEGDGDPILRAEKLVDCALAAQGSPPVSPDRS